ncbi:phage tail sheath C-terminal domain-containing protein [Paracoccus sp. PAR01]|uniref:phage tail sheath family protein n=1 Tax=Paracoccus sp. PAR01 TaxID=2769282 RepID=UPI00178044C0|nr:phage tail sheath C-terminal domain-containing protein [Paracoccus sp. PAR01]MBD9526960.1 phage tail sheath subtilisin-like domain-containing protein [Paracoccus sp. PAR01]
MTTPLTPGVYVREAPGGSRAIEAVPTAVTIFVGETERGPATPTAISSEIQFQRIFGGYFRNDGANGTARLFMPYAVRGFFENGGPRAYVLRLVPGVGNAAATVAQLALDAERAINLTAAGGARARIVQARAPAANEQIRIIIANATDADPQHFNLTVRVSTDNGATFADRAANPTFTNLTTVAGDANNVLTRLAADPDIRWAGPAIRPTNIAAGPAGTLLPPAGAAGGSSLRARGPGIWGNGLRAALTDSTDGDPARFNLTVYYRPVGETNFTEVERFEGLSPDPADEKYLIDQIARSAYLAWGNVDPPLAFRPRNLGLTTGTTPGVELAGATGGNAAFGAANYPAALSRLDGIDDAALIVCASDGLLNAATDAEYNGLVNAVLTYVEARPQRDLFLVADAPRSNASADPVGTAVDHARNGITGSDFRALYWPRIVVPDPAGLGRNPVRAIPSAGHVAGLYGRTDGRRGVWKVAAGIEAAISGTVGLDIQVLDRDQDRMNPHGLNALRTVPGAGRVVWGGRTGRPSTEWRYINVRRTAMFLRKSIFNGIQWAVFEGNDERLWAALRASIGAFMEAQFRNGAFAGETSREAYFVKCDADTTTPDDQAAGVVNVQVGFAPLRPAEFVIVTLSQITRR